MAFLYALTGLLFLVIGVGGLLTHSGFEVGFDVAWVAVGVNFLTMAVVSWRRRSDRVR